MKVLRRVRQFHAQKRKICLDSWGKHGHDIVVPTISSKEVLFSVAICIFYFYDFIN